MKETLTIFLVLVVICLASQIFNINNKNVKLDENFQNYQRYQQSVNPNYVINSEVNPLMYKIAKNLIHKINTDLKTNYQLGQFDNVIEDMDLEGNQRFVLDFFTYRINHQQVNDLNKKIIADVTLLKDTNQLQINTLNFSNALKNDDPSLSIKEDLVGDNNTLILNENLTLQNNNPSAGVQLKPWRGKLEYGKYDDPLPLSVPSNTERNSWILAKEIQDKKDLRRFPCTDLGDWWDINGVELTKEQEEQIRQSGHQYGKELKSELLKGVPRPALEAGKKPKWCYGSYNSATEPLYITGQYYPQHGKQRSPQEENQWMFDFNRGMTTFPRGISGKTGY